MELDKTNEWKEKSPREGTVSKTHLFTHQGSHMYTDDLVQTSEGTVHASSASVSSHVQASSVVLDL